MKKFFVFLLLILSLFNVKLVCALDLSAECAVLYEPVSDRFIFEKNKEVKRGIASTTKIVTAITAIEHGNLSDKVLVSKAAAEIEGSSVWLEEGEVHTLEDLLYALLLSSGNDASIAIAEHIGENVESFATLMNQTARIAGAQNSHFTNPSGLDDEMHYSTAADLAKLYNYADKNAIFSKITQTEEYIMPWKGHPYNRTLQNHNRLLTIIEDCTGGKTGYTKKSGRCLVSSASRNGIQLIAVTLNAPDDWNDHIKLFEYGFSMLKYKTVIKQGTFAGWFDVKNGQKDKIQSVYAKSFSIPTTENDIISTEDMWAKNKTAPIKEGTVVGYSNINLNNKKVGTIDIIANETSTHIPTPNFYAYISAFICNLF